MTYPTDAAIEAALNKWFRLSSPPEPHDYSPSEHDIDDMRAALIAAREAEPPPSLAEFDAAVKDLLGMVNAMLNGQYHGAVESTTLGAFMKKIEALRDLFRRATGEGVGE